jgi:hypothetical protein
LMYKDLHFIVRLVVGMHSVLEPVLYPK